MPWAHPPLHPGASELCCKCCGRGLAVVSVRLAGRFGQKTGIKVRTTTTHHHRASQEEKKKKKKCEKWLNPDFKCLKVCVGVCSGPGQSFLWHLSPLRAVLSKGKVFSVQNSSLTTIAYERSNNGGGGRPYPMISRQNIHSQPCCSVESDLLVQDLMKESKWKAISLPYLH